MRADIIGHARIKYVGKSQSCMVPDVDVDGLIHPTEKELKESGQRSLRKCLKALGCCSMIGVFFGERPDYGLFPYNP